MSLWHRRPKLPADRRPPLDRDERVLAWAESVRGVLVATNRGLWLPPAVGPAADPGVAAADPATGAGAVAGSMRLGWHEIHKATWAGDRLAVIPARVVEELDDYVVVADLPARNFTLADPGELPHQVRTRVTRSVGPSTHYPLAGRNGGVRVVARRISGQDGLTWTARYDPGIDHDDPLVRKATGELVAEARAAATA
jgi:hypothetical protein